MITKSQFFGIPDLGIFLLLVSGILQSGIPLTIGMPNPVYETVAIIFVPAQKLYGIYSLNIALDYLK